MKLTGESRKALQYFFAKKWKSFLLILAASFAFAFLEGLSTFAIYPVIALISPETSIGGHNKYLDEVMLWLNLHSSLPPMRMAVILLFTFTLFKLILGYSNSLFIFMTGNKIVLETQNKIMASVLNADYQFLLNTPKGDLAYRIGNSPGWISKTFTMIPNMIIEGLKSLMLMTMLFMLSPGATLILLGVSFVYFMITRFIAKRVSYGTGSGRARSASNQSICTMNALNGIKVIRLFSATEFWIDIFRKECTKFYLFARKDEAIRGIPTMFLELFSISFICFMVLYLTESGKGFYNNLPVISVFALSLLKMMPSLRQLGNYGMNLMSQLPHVEAAYFALTESELNKAVSDNEGKEPFKEFNSEIEFKNVTFFYKDTDSPAIENLNVTISKGDFIGIIGTSGSGKTTMLDLLAGLLKVTSGEVLIDGMSINMLSMNSRSDHMGYVGQDNFFINDTIRNNILFGRKGFDDSVILDVIHKAGLSEFIQSLPDGLDFVVADAGMKMSGGQRQRLCIARALLCNPEILLLDEATSALDQTTEAEVLGSILKLIKEQKKTVIFVTHRKSAVKYADKILEMRDGMLITNTDFTDSSDRSVHT